jgi:hypothetical protein
LSTCYDPPLLHRTSASISTCLTRQPLAIPPIAAPMSARPTSWSVVPYCILLPHAAPWSATLYGIPPQLDTPGPTLCFVASATVELNDDACARLVVYLRIQSGQQRQTRSFRSRQQADERFPMRGWSFSFERRRHGQAAQPSTHTIHPSQASVPNASKGLASSKIRPYPSTSSSAHASPTRPDSNLGRARRWCRSP